MNKSVNITLSQNLAINFSRMKNFQSMRKCVFKFVLDLDFSFIPTVRPNDLILHANKKSTLHLGSHYHIEMYFGSLHNPQVLKKLFVKAHKTAKNEFHVVNAKCIEI